jgi:hypothetical protein
LSGQKVAANPAKHLFCHGVFFHFLICVGSTNIVATSKKWAPVRLSYLLPTLDGKILGFGPFHTKVRFFCPKRRQKLRQPERISVVFFSFSGARWIPMRFGMLNHGRSRFDFHTFFHFCGAEFFPPGFPPQKPFLEKSMCGRPQNAFLMVPNDSSSSN